MDLTRPLGQSSLTPRLALSRARGQAPRPPRGPTPKHTDHIGIGYREMWVLYSWSCERERWTALAAEQQHGSRSSGYIHSLTLTLIRTRLAGQAREAEDLRPVLAQAAVERVWRVVVHAAHVLVRRLFSYMFIRRLLYGHSAIITCSFGYYHMFIGYYHMVIRRLSHIHSAIITFHSAIITWLIEMRYTWKAALGYYHMIIRLLSHIHSAIIRLLSPDLSR